MPLDAYPFSEKYGWVIDKYGLSWQVMYMGDFEIKQKITPTLMFVGDQCGNAEEAIRFYTPYFNIQALDISLDTARMLHQTNQARSAC